MLEDKVALAYAGEGASLVLTSRSEGSIRPVAEEAENLVLRYSLSPRMCLKARASRGWLARRSTGSAV